MKRLAFSPRRAIGISGIKAKMPRNTGIPTTKQGLERKTGQAVISSVIGRKKCK